MPITCGSLNRGVWGSRSATSSRCRCAELITGKTTGSVTSKLGGPNWLSIRSKRHSDFGLRRVVPNQGKMVCSRRTRYATTTSHPLSFFRRVALVEREDTSRHSRYREAGAGGVELQEVPSDQTRHAGSLPATRR